MLNYKILWKQRRTYLGSRRQSADILVMTFVFFYVCISEYTSRGESASVGFTYSCVRRGLPCRAGSPVDCLFWQKLFKDLQSSSWDCYCLLLFGASVCFVIGCLGTTHANVDINLPLQRYIWWRHCSWGRKRENKMTNMQNVYSFNPTKRKESDHNVSSRLCCLLPSHLFCFSGCVVCSFFLPERLRKSFNFRR